MVDPQRLLNYDLDIGELAEKLQGIVENKTGNFLVTSEQEYGIRIIGRTTDLETIKQTVVAQQDGRLVTLGDIADVVIGAQPNPRGDASINAQPAVLMSITKQPGQNTLDLTDRVRTALEELQPSLGGNVQVHEVFAQEKFIQNGISNITTAARDAAIIVLVVLLLFLGNLRATAITLIALPFSFVVAILILLALKLEINVMTLGGLAVAIGELTDDAVISVENTIRRLRQNKQQGNPLPVFEIILKASSEIRGSVIFSTILVVFMFLPLFALSGIEGRLLAPLGFAYIIALIASTIVAMTVTAAFCSLLLPGSKLLDKTDYTWFARKIKDLATPLIRWSIRNGKAGLLLAFIATIFTAILAVNAGKEFLPPFNEGTLTINVSLEPGTSLKKSNEIGVRVEKAILGVPNVLAIGRRSGRAEADEHANGVNISEMEVDIMSDVDKDVIIEHIQIALQKIDLQGANVSIGQPISHRIEHILSGVRAPLVIKIFGPDLEVLRVKANQLRDLMEAIPGTLQPVVQQEVLVPQINIEPNRDALAKFGFGFDEFTEDLEIALSGLEVGTLLEGNRSYNLTMRIAPESVNDLEKIQSILVKAPNGAIITLSQVAQVKESRGQNTISHDNGQRRIVVASGILNGDSVTIIETLKKQVASQMDMPQGYFISYEGTYKSQQESSRKLIFFSLIALLGIVIALYLKFQSMLLVFQILINVPVTFLGGMIAINLTGDIINLSGLVGLISLLGLAARNGILLIEHWLYLIHEEGLSFCEETILQGSLNRLIPMLMTSLTSMMALLPLIIGGNQPGKEMLYPLSVVVFGGLLVSTIVEMLIRPGLFVLMEKQQIKKVQ